MYWLKSVRGTGCDRCLFSEVQMYSIYREVNRGMSFVRCIEVVRFSEGLLLEVLLYCP